MAMKAEHYLEIKNLKVDYLLQGEKVSALNTVNLFLEQGEMGVIIGPSGCGKSTLINVLAGLNHHYTGSVEINGKVPMSGGETSLIIQDYGLLPWKTVWENVILGLRFRKKEAQDIKDRVEAILSKMDLTILADRFPSQLSGGQRQRVAIARSLVLEPKLLLMDEPFSSLDALTREEIQDFVLAIWQETHLTTLLITHNIEEAVFLGQKIFVMSACPGQIVEKVDNPLAGNSDLRGKVQFLEMATYLRSLLHQSGEGRCSFCND